MEFATQLASRARGRAPCVPAMRSTDWSRAMTYEERLKQLHEWVLELATSPLAPREQVIGDLVWLRREVDLQIVALQEEGAEEPSERPDELPG